MTKRDFKIGMISVAIFCLADSMMALIIAPVIFAVLLHPLWLMMSVGVVIIMPWYVILMEYLLELLNGEGYDGVD